ncbi:zinc ABC transporter substrate-binding protein [Rhodobacteraceae bacterium D3-12]|nr:zinc ABC transporter substrate-binding protein [Rhodobacteraceae bacterium D3-12]
MTLSRRFFLSITTGAALAPLATAARAAGPLSAVATTGMIADAAMRVGGENVTVQALMGAGVDPHSYRQTRSDIVALTRADLILRHGLYLEAQMEDVFEKLAKRGTLAVIGDAFERDQLLAHADYENKFDPHLWMVPGLWRVAVEAVRDALIDARPEAKASFTANAAAYLDEIEALSGYATTVLATVPEESRVLVTAHDAFGYFGRAFGYEVIGIQGISTESEAGLSRIAELVDLLVSRKISAAFVESSVSDRNIRALIEGAGAKGHKVAIGGELFSDAMGQPGSYEGTYIGMIDHNVTTIARALGGDTPERGMSGRLAMAS